MIPFKLVSMTRQSGSCNSPLPFILSSQKDVVWSPAFAMTMSICPHAFMVVANRAAIDCHDCTSARMYAHRLNVKL